MAKGVEDTAFYRWNRLAALNEVGGDPDRFGVPPEEFHAWCERLLRHWPTSMTTLSTHDTKRAEDARARLAVLSQVPGRVGGRGARLGGGGRPALGAASTAPTRYLLWQTLVATWDLEAGAPISEARLHEYLTKAVREAKVHTTWTTPTPSTRSRCATSRPPSSTSRRPHRVAGSLRRRRSRRPRGSRCSARSSCS